MSSRRKSYARLMSEVAADKAERAAWQGGLVGRGLPTTNPLREGQGGPTDSDKTLQPPPCADDPNV